MYRGAQSFQKSWGAMALPPAHPISVVSAASFSFLWRFAEEGRVSEGKPSGVSEEEL